MPGQILLSLAYHAPIQYFSKIISSDNVLIEQHENFQKQTYRNRCVIAAANGPISLVVPVEKARNRKIKMKDIKIHNVQAWQRNHWRSIFSAYNSSPYFEFYRESLKEIYDKPWKYLLDFNLKTTNWLLGELEIDCSIILTDNYMEDDPGIQNFRDKISPKNKEQDHSFSPIPYTQVFSERFGFQPNLSILDLLFNEGPNSYTILENSISKA